MAPFESLCKDAKKCEIANQRLDLLKIDLKKIAYSSFNRYNFLKELNLSRPEYDALKKLSSNKDVVIQKSDKGNSVVVVNRQDYLNRMQEMVDDVSKFEEVRVDEGKDYNFMTKQTKEVNELLTELLKKNSITQTEREQLSPNGPSPARLY